MVRVKPDYRSPYPAARVARLPKDAASKKSGVLVARSMEYLAVRVLFHGTPVAGLKVEFGRIDDIDDKSPEKMAPALMTDEQGVACFPRLVVAGIYACALDRQLQAVVPTVPQLDKPCPVVLPVGRPFVDVFDVDEFAPRSTGEA
jgi:hypothetical protein